MRKLFLTIVGGIFISNSLAALDPGEVQLGASMGYGLHSTPFFEGQVNLYYFLLESTSIGLGLGFSPMLPNVGINVFTEYSIGPFFLNGTLGLNIPLTKKQFPETVYLGFYPGIGFKLVPENIKDTMIPNKIWINYGIIFFETGDLVYIKNIHEITNNWNIRIGFGW